MNTFLWKATTVFLFLGLSMFLGCADDQPVSTVVSHDTLPAYDRIIYTGNHPDTGPSVDWVRSDGTQQGQLIPTFSHLTSPPFSNKVTVRRGPMWPFGETDTLVVFDILTRTSKPIQTAPGRFVKDLILASNGSLLLFYSATEELTVMFRHQVS